MADKCAWMIVWGDGLDAQAQSVAAVARQYGLVVKGQRWPTNEKQAWLASADEALQANAAVILLVTTPAAFVHSDVRRTLSLFRLLLQTRLARRVDGFVFAYGEPAEPDVGPKSAGVAVLGDWATVAPGDRWAARAVARAFAPSKSNLPVRLAIFAQERLGVWLEVRPTLAEEIAGCLAGISGNGAKITFHAVGSAGHLPDRTVNEFELKGIRFEAVGHSFEAWGLQNKIASDQSYFVRLDGEPDYLAIATLPDGELSEIDCVRLV
jgi:hypothetical protein